MSERIINEKTKKNVICALSLLSSVINGAKPKEPEFEPDWDFIYRFTRAHNVDNTLFYAVEQLENKPAPELYKKWMDERNKCVHRDMIQRREYAAVCAEFEEKGVEYMPLKGFAVSDLYPIPESRFMSDIDLLIKNSRAEAEEILQKHGYQAKKHGIDYDKPFYKPPFTVIELHNNLFPKYHAMYPYFMEPFAKGKGEGSRYLMNETDFYLYETAHLFKHYDGGGSGIRSVMDFYLINNSLRDGKVIGEIQEKLKEIGLFEFSEMINKIADKWFKYEDYSELSDDELYILSSGTYGTNEHFTLNKRAKYSGRKYFEIRLFPPRVNMYEYYPSLKKRPFCLPFYYIYRLVTGVLFKREKIRGEYKALRKNSK